MLKFLVLGCSPAFHTVRHYASYMYFLSLSFLICWISIICLGGSEAQLHLNMKWSLDMQNILTRDNTGENWMMDPLPSKGLAAKDIVIYLNSILGLHSAQPLQLYAELPHFPCPGFSGT